MAEYTKVKKKYNELMMKEAEKQIKTMTSKELATDAIFNKYEIHDTRILLGVITDVLLKNKLITRKELEAGIASAYKDEMAQHKAHRVKKKK